MKMHLHLLDFDNSNGIKRYRKFTCQRCTKTRKVTKDNALVIFKNKEPYLFKCDICKRLVCGECKTDFTFQKEKKHDVMLCKDCLFLWFKNNGRVVTG